MYIILGNAPTRLMPTLLQTPTVSNKGVNERGKKKLQSKFSTI